MGKPCQHSLDFPDFRGRWPVSGGLIPNLLYPLLWLAPIFLLLALKKLGSQHSTLTDLSKGQWAGPVLWGFSALVCGFFWEMWNWQSEARWIYHVPLVGEFKVFEMPILGYAGYLPFGWICAEVVTVFSLKSDTK